MEFFIKNYLFYFNKYYKVLKKKLYNIVDKDINISKDDKIKLFKEMENTFEYKNENGEPLRNPPYWENILNYWNPYTRKNFDLLEGETEEEKEIRLNKIKTEHSQKKSKMESFMNSLDSKVMDEFNNFRKEIIEISQDIINKIENNTITKKDIDIFLQKYENIIAKRLKNIINIEINKEFPKLKIILSISAIFILAISLMAILIKFLRKNNKKHLLKHNKN